MNRRIRDLMQEAPAQADWRQWLQCHAPRFLLFARQQARTEADAQDLVQESLVEALERQGDEAPPPPALVLATIRRRAIDWGRRADRRNRREHAAVEDAREPWFETSPEDRDLGQWAQDALQGLPDMYREVITLRLWGELTFAEVAETLGIPANTAASRYRLGLAELRRLAKEVLI